MSEEVIINPPSQLFNGIVAAITLVCCCYLVWNKFWLWTYAYHTDGYLKYNFLVAFIIKTFIGYYAAAVLWQIFWYDYINVLFTLPVRLGFLAGVLLDAWATWRFKGDNPNG